MRIIINILMFNDCKIGIINMQNYQQIKNYLAQVSEFDEFTNGQVFKRPITQVNPKEGQQLSQWVHTSKKHNRNFSEQQFMKNQSVSSRQSYFRITLPKILTNSAFVCTEEGNNTPINQPHKKLVPQFISSLNQSNENFGFIKKIDSNYIASQKINTLILKVQKTNQNIKRRSLDNQPKHAHFNSSIEMVRKIYRRRKIEEIKNRESNNDQQKYIKIKDINKQMINDGIKWCQLPEKKQKSIKYNLMRFTTKSGKRNAFNFQKNDFCLDTKIKH